MAPTGLRRGNAARSAAVTGGGVPIGAMRFVSHFLFGAAVALALAACGSSTNSNDSVSGKRAAGLAFAQCMRSHGVANFPDPGSNANGGLQIQDSQRAGSGQTLSVNGVRVNSPAFQSAMQACRSKLPNGGHPTAIQSAKAHQTALAFSRCMRAHGITNFPDPQFHGAGVTMQLSQSSGINPQSPAFQAAQNACGKAFGKAPETAKAP